MPDHKGDVRGTFPYIINESNLIITGLHCTEWRHECILKYAAGDIYIRIFINWINSQIIFQGYFDTVV